LSENGQRCSVLPLACFSGRITRDATSPPSARHIQDGVKALLNPSQVVNLPPHAPL